MSAKLDITSDRLQQDSYRVIHAGDDYDIQFTAVRNGVALDITGATIYFTVKDDEIKTDANAKLQLSTALIAEVEITDATAGEFTVHLVGSGSKSTASLSGQELPYDIQAILASGTKITLARGVIEFLAQITRAIT